MQRQLRTIFGAYLPLEQINNEDLLQGELLEIVLDRKNLSMVCYVKFKKIISLSCLKSLEQTLSDALSLQQVIFRCQYAPDLFSIDYFPQLITALQSKHSIINGYFDNASASLVDQILTIHLKHGGGELMQKSGILKAISAFIVELFSLKLTVKFSGVVALDRSAAMPLPESLTPMPQPVKKSLPEPIKAPVHNALPPWDDDGSVDLLKASQPNQHVVQPEVHAIKVESIGQSIGDDLSFSADGAIQLLGKPIKKQPTSLAELTEGADNVVVWGQVFESDYRLTRNKDKMILSVYFTDFTNSSTLNANAK